MSWVLAVARRNGECSWEENETNEFEPRGGTDRCANNDNRGAARASSLSSSGAAARTGSSGEGNGSSRVDNKSKADGEHPEDPEREDGKWMRTEGNKRRIIEEEEDSMPKEKQSGGMQEVVEVAEVGLRTRLSL